MDGWVVNGAQHRPGSGCWGIAIYNGMAWYGSVWEGKGMVREGGEEDVVDMYIGGSLERN